MAGLGVGLAGKSTAGNIWTRSRGQGNQMPRIITIPFAVKERRDSSKRNIVAGGTAATVQKGGNSRCPQLDLVVAPLRSA